MNGRRMLWILARLQARRFLNRLQTWRAWSAGTIFCSALVLVLSLMGMHLVLWSSLQRLLDNEDVRQVLQKSMGTALDPLRFTRYEDVSDQGARLMLLFLNSTLLSALFLKWGHWQSSQRDAEWEWFAERPWPAWPLFIQRCLIESIQPQGFSLFILPFFVLLAVLRGWHPLPAFGSAVMILVVLQALLAAPRLSLDLWLRLCWSENRVRTFRAMSAVVGAALLVCGMQALSMELAWAIRSLHHWGAALDATPVALALSVVMLRDHRLGLEDFIWLLAWVVTIHALCYAWAAWALRRPMPGPANSSDWEPKTRERWTGLRKFLWYRLHALTRRDLVLLWRDRYFMLQILVTPLVFAIIPQSLPLQNPDWLLVMAFATGLLFLWSAVFHILPMEGRSLWMLFTWPQSLAGFLRRRLHVLLILTGFYVSLVLGLGFMRAGKVLPFDLLPVVFMGWGLRCFGRLLTALAVLNYQSEAGDRERRPGMLLNSGILLLGSGYGWFLLQPMGLASLLVPLLLSGLTAYGWWRMQLQLPALLDQHASSRKAVTRVAFKLYFLRLITR